MTLQSVQNIRMYSLSFFISSRWICEILTCSELCNSDQTPDSYHATMQTLE